MAIKTIGTASLFALVALMLIPAAAWSQTGIAGVVKDSSGGILPGVTVEAASPALIEKVRTVVTDGQGQYKIVDLRPGVYSVTFSLEGFSTIKREGIELTTNFTAQVNPEMRVGALSETVTVSGQSPVVDVQNVVQSRVITKETVNAVPNARMFEQIATLIPGMNIRGGAAKPSGQDVGGTASEGQQRVSIHGGRGDDMYALLDGLPENTMTSFSASGVYLDAGAIQEFSYELGGVSAETPTGGVRINSIPKDGGNRFTGTFYSGYTDHRFQSDNLTDALRARGASTSNGVNKIWDVNAGIGGPVKQDRLWFYGSGRSWGHSEFVTGMWYAKDPRAFVFTPDLSRPAIDDTSLHSESLRLTWQATGIHKISGFVMNEDRCACHAQVSATRAPEATTHTHNPRDALAQVTWSAPVTNRLLLDGGFMYYPFYYSTPPQDDVPSDILSVTEQSTSLIFRAAAPDGDLINWAYNSRGSMSYVTGSHAFKVGFTLQQGHRAPDVYVNGDLSLAVLNGVPRSVTEWTTPYVNKENLNAALGLYAQDKWTIKRLTMNAGLRFDHHNESVPEQHLPAARFVGARDFAAISDVPNWNDLSPRLGVAYDLFGTGKTAVKATLSRYVAGETIGFANANNPVITSVNSASRTWTDSNGNFYPDCNFLDPAVNGECGPLSNSNFGKLNVTTRYDDALRTGWGVRPMNWETSASVQHELLPQVSLNATYVYRVYGNFRATDNVLVNPSDYDPFCVTAPADSRLPGGGGYQVCGLYDLNPRKVGQVSNLVTNASNFGKQYEHWNGVDVTLSARLAKGGQVSGGLSTGRTVFDNCDVTGKVDNGSTEVGTGSAVATMASPSQLTCHQAPPFQPQVKFNGVMRLPWNLQAAGTFQSLPGPEITARYVATNAQIAPSLGRNLSSGANGTATLELIQPGTMFADRLYEVDIRMTKTIQVGRARINGNLDLYNALNSSTVLLLNTRYGPAWQQPTYILPGRLFKFGAAIDF